MEQAQQKRQPETARDRERIQAQSMETCGEKCKTYHSRSGERGNGLLLVDYFNDENVMLPVTTEGRREGGGRSRNQAASEVVIAGTRLQGMGSKICAARCRSEGRAC